MGWQRSTHDSIWMCFLLICFEIIGYLVTFIGVLGLSDFGNNDNVHLLIFYGSFWLVVIFPTCCLNRCCELNKLNKAVFYIHHMVCFGVGIYAFTVDLQHRTVWITVLLAIGIAMYALSSPLLIYNLSTTMCCCSSSKNEDSRKEIPSVFMSETSSDQTVKINVGNHNAALAHEPPRTSDVISTSPAHINFASPIPTQETTTASPSSMPTQLPSPPPMVTSSTLPSPLPKSTTSPFPVQETINTSPPPGPFAFNFPKSTSSTS